MSRLPSITAVSTPRTARRGRIEPVGHPGRVDPRPPDDEQQERRPRHAGDGEVAEDLVRQLRDREDVDEVEEQLDRGRRLRRCPRRAGAGGGPSRSPARVESAGVGVDPVRREIERALGRPGGGDAPAAPGGLRGARGSAGRARTASRAPQREARGRAPSRAAGTATTTTRIASGGHTRSPTRTTAATSTAPSPPPTATSASKARCSICSRWAVFMSTPFACVSGVALTGAEGSTRTIVVRTGRPFGSAENASTTVAPRAARLLRAGH